MENSLGTFLHRISLLPAPQVESACFRATRLPPLACTQCQQQYTSATIFFQCLKYVFLSPHLRIQTIPCHCLLTRTELASPRVICCCDTLRCTLAYAMRQLYLSHVPASNQGTKPNQPELNKPLSNFLMACPSRGCF